MDRLTLRDNIDRLLEAARLHPKLPEPRQHLNTALAQQQAQWEATQPAGHATP